MWPANTSERVSEVIQLHDRRQLYNPQSSPLHTDEVPGTRESKKRPIGCGCRLRKLLTAGLMGLQVDFDLILALCPSFPFLPLFWCLFALQLQTERHLGEDRECEGHDGVSYKNRLNATPILSVSGS